MAATISASGITGTDTDTGNEESGMLGRLPREHADLLTFLSLAQDCYANLLEYIPRYDDRNTRGGGNSAVQMVYLSSGGDANDRPPSFAFKRLDLSNRFDPEAQLKKIICELIIYENPTVSFHPNIGKLRGISWATTIDPAVNASVPTVTPVLGFEPSKGNLAEIFAIKSFSFLQKLELCRDIGQALEALHSLSKVIF